MWTHGHFFNSGKLHSLIFCNSCYICSSHPYVIHRLNLHVLSSIATIFTHIFIPSFSLGTPVKFVSFYSTLLTWYSILYFFLLVTPICILISWSSTAFLVMLKHFLILPIMPASQRVVQITWCFYIFKACFSCTMFRMSKSFKIFSSGSCRNSFAVIFCSFKFYVSFPHSAVLFS